MMATRYFPCQEVPGGLQSSLVEVSVGFVVRVMRRDWEVPGGRWLIVFSPFNNPEQPAHFVNNNYLWRPCVPVGGL